MADSTDKLIKELKKDFVVIHKSRVRAVYAYVAIALILGIGIGIGFVIGQNQQQSSEAATFVRGVRRPVYSYTYSDGKNETVENLTMISGRPVTPPPGKTIPTVLNAAADQFGLSKPYGSKWVFADSSLTITPQNVNAVFIETFTLPAGEVTTGQLNVAALTKVDVWINGVQVLAPEKFSDILWTTYGRMSNRLVTATVASSTFKTNGEPNILKVYRKATLRGEAQFSGIAYALTVGVRPGATAQCSDKVDNDGDGKIDSADPGCHSDGNVANSGSYVSTRNSELDSGSGGTAQCSDGTDNDGDGKIDLNDPGCSGDKDDNSELDSETGTFSISLAPTSPGAHITYDNSTDHVATFKLAASGGQATISEATFKIAGCTTVSKVIVKDGTTTIGSKPCASSVTFTGLNSVIQNNSWKELMVYLELSTVGPNAGTSGENVKVILDQVKQAQGTLYNNDVSGNNVYVFAAVPTVSETSIGTTPILGSMEIYKWTVTANGGTISSKQFGFKMGIQDNAPNGTLTLSNFVLYKDGSDYTSNVTIRDQAGNNLKTGGSTFDKTDTAVYITFGSAAQGEDSTSGSATYSLWATAAGFGSNENDSFKIEMPADNAQTSRRYVSDADGTSGEIIATVANGSGSKASLPIYYIWSDNSASPHSSSIRDYVAGGGIPPPDNLTFSADWWNGYLVKSFPLSANTFTY